jgi:hypothetical protein
MAIRSSGYGHDDNVSDHLTPPSAANRLTQLNRNCSGLIAVTVALFGLDETKPKSLDSDAGDQQHPTSMRGLWMQALKVRFFVPIILLFGCESLSTIIVSHADIHRASIL